MSRIKIIRISIYCSFVMILAHLFYLQCVRGQYFFYLSKNNSIRIVFKEGIRGRILDRNGVVLADNQPAFNVVVVPQEIQDDDRLFQFLADVLNQSKKDITVKYTKEKSVPFEPLVIARDVSRKKAVMIEENKFQFPGLLVEESFKRRYPAGKAGAHILGYVGKINRQRKQWLKNYGYTHRSLVGYGGVEEYYDQYLRGEEGGQQIEVNSRGRQVRMLSLKQPAAGEDIHLTIDSRIQTQAAELLEGHRGAIIVMDAQYGEVLGMVSSPSYDPNLFINDTQKAAALFSDRGFPLFNRALTGRYPPGSVFKIAAAVAGLREKKVSAYHTTFNCPGYLESGGRRFRCAHTHGQQNLIEAIAHSCNVYFYHLGGLLGPKNLHAYSVLLGLGERTNIDLPFESDGFVPHPQKRADNRPQRWYKGDTFNFAIGQGDVLTTPLQVSLLMSIIFSNGEIVRPHVIKAVGDTEIKKYRAKRKIVMDKNIFEVISSGLRAAVEDDAGTAHVVNTAGLDVKGKTGTAQTSGGQKAHAWFSGTASSQKRKIVFTVFLEHGGSSYNAALIAQDLLVKLHEKNIL